MGKLTDGTIFDSSFERGDPIEFELGSGQVIKGHHFLLSCCFRSVAMLPKYLKGWDQGLLGMCLGEKRKLKIPSKLGYGEQGSPPTIRGGATLVFDTELVGVNGKTLNDGKPDDNEL
ncbi:FK506-binding protein 15 [Orobanche gracilis]